MNDRLTELADSYLEHIRIAVRVRDRGAPFRDFFDNWNAFRSDASHHRSRGERPRWFNNPSASARSKMLYSLDFRSIGATEILSFAQAEPTSYRQRHQARDREIRLIVDHAVPIGVMVDMLFDRQSNDAVELSRDGIDAHLKRWYRLGLVSHAENGRIDAAGLSFKMPGNCDRKDHFARYEAVGIRASS